MSNQESEINHILFLDGIRAIAVLIVIFRHFNVSSYFPGGFGVTVFFFLCVFLISTLIVN